MTKLQSCAIFSILLLSVGCGGADEFSTYDTQTKGTGGQNNEPGNLPDNSDGTLNGKVDNSGGTSSGGNENVSGGSSGVITSGGTGGDRTGGGNTCIPKTCDEVTFELTGEIVDEGLEGSACGAFDNGCGGILTCNPCNSSGFKCGGPLNVRMYRIWADNGYVEGIPGVCGGGCIEQTTVLLKEEYCGPEKKAYSCSNYGTPEGNNCYQSGMFGPAWCCDN